MTNSPLPSGRPEQPASTPYWEPARDDRFGLTDEPERVILVGADGGKVPRAVRRGQRRARKDAAQRAKQQRRDAEAQAKRQAKLDARQSAQLARDARVLTIGLPRRGSLLTAVLVFCTVASVVMTVTRPEFLWQSQLPALLPLLTAVAAAGVASLPEWGLRLVRECGRVWTVLAPAPLVGVLFASVAVPHLELPWWVGPAVGGWAVLPLLYSAIAPRRLRPKTVVEPDAYGARGVWLIAGALAVQAYALTRPEIEAFVGVVLALALLVGAFLTRGVADGAKTWPLVSWLALTWGAVVCWAAVPVRALTEWLQQPSATVGLVLVAALPLVLTLIGRWPASD